MSTLTELNLYPVKSCAGIALSSATVTFSGLMSGPIHDREWMVVDSQGNFVTQRECPAMALITPAIKSDVLQLTAPGMASLDIPLAFPAPDLAKTCNVQVWDDRIKAYDCGDTAANWFSQATGMTCRLVRFHPEAKRLANQRWTGNTEAPTLFSDGFPVLVISDASLADLNEKLVQQARIPLPMNRFRPNLVFNGVEAFEEDYAASITIGEVCLKPVKPCPRCTIPAIDQTTGLSGPDPLDILQHYRANHLVDGGITFGMNAILLQGNGNVVKVGQQVEIELAF